MKLYKKAGHFRDLAINPKKYIISQKLTYLTFGIINGYFIGITPEPYKIPFLLFL